MNPIIPDGNNKWVTIGDQQYAKEIVDKLTPEYIDLIKIWQNFDFSKWGGIEEFLLCGILEAMLIELGGINYISTSYAPYPSFPLDNFELAGKYVEAVTIAQSIVTDFKVPPQKEDEGNREYLGRIADAFERQCENRHLVDLKDKDPVANIAADSFLKLCVEDTDLILAE